MRDFQEIFEEIKQWQLATFRYATPQSAATHLKREAKELFDDPYDAEEMADVFLLLVAVAHLTDTDLEAAIEKKMQINYRRQWQEPDAEGVVEHVKEPQGKTLLEIFQEDKIIQSDEVYALNADGERIGKHFLKLDSEGRPYGVGTTGEK